MFLGSAYAEIITYISRSWSCQFDCKRYAMRPWNAADESQILSCCWEGKSQWHVVCVMTGSNIGQYLQTILLQWTLGWVERDSFDGDKYRAIALLAVSLGQWLLLIVWRFTRRRLCSSVIRCWNFAVYRNLTELKFGLPRSESHLQYVLVLAAKGDARQCALP